MEAARHRWKLRVALGEVVLERWDGESEWPTIQLGLLVTFPRFGRGIGWPTALRRWAFYYRNGSGRTAPKDFCIGVLGIGVIYLRWATAAELCDVLKGGAD